MLKHVKGNLRDYGFFPKVGTAKLGELYIVQNSGSFVAVVRLMKVIQSGKYIVQRVDGRGWPAGPVQICTRLYDLQSGMEQIAEMTEDFFELLGI